MLDVQLFIETYSVETDTKVHGMTTENEQQQNNRMKQLLVLSKGKYPAL